MSKAKEEFVVIHGKVKAPHKDKKAPEGKEAHADFHQLVGFGEVVELDPDEAKKMDPQGTSLMPKAQWDAEVKAKAAAEKAKAESLAASAKAAAEKAKGGGK